MLLEEAQQELAKLGLITFRLTDPTLGIGVGTKKSDEPNAIVDPLIIRLLENSWCVFSTLSLFADIGCFESLSQAVDFVRGIHKPSGVATSLTVEQAIKFITDRGLEAVLTDRMDITEIWGGAPWSIKVDNFLAAHEFVIRQKLEGWLGIATVGYSVDFVASGHLKDVVKELVDYFDAKQIQITTLGIKIPTR